MEIKSNEKQDAQTVCLQVLCTARLSDADIGKPEKQYA
jgi:hypothetical protein